MPYSELPIAQFAAQRGNLRFVCNECGASVVAPIAEVARRFGLAAHVGDVQSHLACRACHSIDVIVVPDSSVLA